MADIFLSYSREDSEVMQRLYQELQAAGFSVWIDHSELVAGTPSWQIAIEQAIHESAYMIVILSPDAKASKWVEAEVKLGEAFRAAYLSRVGTGRCSQRGSLRLSVK